MSMRRIFLSALLIPTCVLAGCTDGGSDADPGYRISADGMVRGIGVGSTSSEVKRQFGKPVKDSDSYPVEPVNADPDVDHKWSEISGPYHYGPGGPPDRVQRTLIYDDISFYTIRGKVIGYLITGEGSETSEGLAIGDSLDRASEMYPDAVCEADYKDETTSVREANCNVDLDEQNLNVTDDPIESFTVGASGLPY